MKRKLGVCMLGKMQRAASVVAMCAGMAPMIPQIASAQYADQQPKPGLTTTAGNVQLGIYGTLIVNIAGGRQ